MKHLKSFNEGLKEDYPELNQFFVRYCSNGDINEIKQIVENKTNKSGLDPEMVGKGFEKANLNGKSDVVEYLLQQFEIDKHFIDVGLLNACTHGMIICVRIILEYIQEHPDILVDDPDDLRDDAEGVNIYANSLWAVKHGYLSILKMIFNFGHGELYMDQYDHWKVTLRESKWDILMWLIHNSEYDLNQLIIELLPWKRTYGFALIVQEKPEAMNIVNMQKKFDIF